MIALIIKGHNSAPTKHVLIMLVSKDRETLKVYSHHDVSLHCDKQLNFKLYLK